MASVRILYAMACPNLTIQAVGMFLLLDGDVESLTAISIRGIASQELVPLALKIAMMHSRMGKFGAKECNRMNLHLHLHSCLQ